MEACNSFARKLFVLVLSLVVSGICLANPTMYMGSLSVADGGLTAYGLWDCPTTTLSWEVDNVTTQGKWHYTYTLFVPYKDISHMIIEASNGENPFTSENLFSVGSSPAGWIHSVEIQNFLPNNSTPYMPEEMYGIKFDTTQGSVYASINFDSDQAPAWGDFYSKDGYSSCLGWNALYNTGFTLNDYDPVAPAMNGSLENHILVPDSYVPAPGAMILVCIGTAVTGILRKRQMI